MPWTKLEDDFHSNPKVIEMGLEGAGLYARALSYCGAYLTDGFVPEEWAKSVAGRRPKLILHLVQVRAWRKVKGGYLIPHYLHSNPSKEEVLKLAEQKAKAGRKGARSRWHRDTSHDKPMAGPMATAMAPAMAPATDLPMAESWQSDGSARAGPDPIGSSSKGRARTEVHLNGLPFEKNLLVLRLMAWIGNDADAQTKAVISKAAEDLPPSSLAKVLESALTKRPQQRARYAVGALRSERSEAQA